MDHLKKGIENVKDAISEAGHRSAADGEKAKRELLGDQMTTSEKIGSAVNQAKEATQAEIDAGKQKARNNT